MQKVLRMYFLKMNNKRTLIFQHLHRTGGTTVFSVMRRYFDGDAMHRIDKIMSNEKRSVERFLSFSQNERDNIKLLYGHLPFGLHIHFSHPCDYITIVRDPIERVLSEYARLMSWRDLSHIKNSEKARGMSLKDFINSNFAATNNYQTRVISKNWTDQYEEVSPIGEDELAEAKQNLKKYFIGVGVTDRLDEAIVVFAKMFGWKNPYYFEKKYSTNRDGAVPRECREAMKEKNKLDMELYRFAGQMLDESIARYGFNFKGDLRRFQRMNGFLGICYNVGLRLPYILRKPLELALRPFGYEPRVNPVRNG